MAKKLVVTSALPYANGPIHVGHLVEYIQTDIFVRFLKLIGEPAIYCCADDTHGTPIEISAKKEGILPEQLIERYHEQHLKDFTDFQIAFDSYHSTNSPENKKHSDFIFNKLNEKGLVYQKELELTYCEKCSRFLPDRYVKGKCPKCKAEDQYGDVCEKCNATYNTTDLVEPFCTVCGSRPIRKTSRHYFFKLSACSKDLENWLNGNKKLQPEVKNYVLNWIKEGLQDWCISRDGPYFGFKIPGEENKYYYVWLDAPIGYIASTENYCKQHGEKVEDYWNNGRAIHFIGKDITYFHFLFWPAMLMNSGFNLPENIVVHGFLTVNKEKMSKSRGTFITARQYLENLDPQYLRFYYAANLAPTMSDLDLDFQDLKTKINNELVANIGNFTYRVLSFLEKNFDGQIIPASEPEIEKDLAQKFDEIKKCYESYNFREAVKLMLEVGSIGNKYMQEKEPWKLIKTDEKKTQEIVSFCANMAKNIAIIMKPILPRLSEDIEKQLNLSSLKWSDLGFNLKEHKIGKAAMLIRKIEDEQINKFGIKEPFAQLDLQVAKILDAKQHPDAEKLLVLDVLAKEKRQLVAGLAKHYNPEELIGKNIVIIANLKPAKLRGIVSAGMLLAAQEDEKVVALEAPNSQPGDQVHIDDVKSNPAKQIDIAEFAEVKLKVNEGKAYYKNSVLKTKSEDIKVKGIHKGDIH